MGAMLCVRNHAATILYLPVHGTKVVTAVPGVNDVGKLTRLVLRSQFTLVKKHISMIKLHYFRSCKNHAIALLIFRIPFRSEPASKLK